MITSHEESIYERSMRLSDVGVIVFDLDLKRVFVDDTAARIMGQPKEALLGGGVGGGLTPEATEEVTSRLQQCIETGQGTSRRIFPREVNGRIIYTAGHQAPLHDETGSITGVLVMLSDVTEAVEASREAQQSGELYRSLVEAVGGAVIRLDRSGKRTFVSDGADRMKGRSKDELLKGVLGDDMLPEDRDATHELLEKIFQTGESFYGVTTKQQIGGGTRHIVANWVPVFNEDGSVREIQTTSMDITEQVSMREQLRLYSARIRKAQEEERAAISRVLHDETMQTLTAVGHRLDTIMAGHDLPRSITNELESLANVLLDQSDALRRMCMGLRPAMLDRMGLGAAVEWLVRRKCAENGMSGAVRIDEGLERLNPNVEIRLFRIAQEAVNNAVRHAQAKRVQVNLGITDGHLELEVEDDGIGFDAGTSHMELLYHERLGLLGMRERAHMLGAELDIQSSPGEGCRILLRGSIEQMEANV